MKADGVAGIRNFRHWAKHLVGRSSAVADAAHDEGRAPVDRQALQEVSGIEPQRLVQISGNARGFERVCIDAGLD
jgi:hypothetical protein